MSFQEEDPEVGQGEEFLFVSEDVQVKQFRHHKLSLGIIVLEFNFEHSTVILFWIIVLNKLNVNVLAVIDMLDNKPGLEFFPD